MSSGKPPTPTRVGDCLKETASLARLLQRGRTLALLQQQLAQALPEDLQYGWQLARFDAEGLVLVTDSPARVTRLRFAQPQLLRAAQDVSGVRPRSLKIKVAPPARPQVKTDPARLSSRGGALLQEAAAGMTDPRLAQALRRLARRAASTDDQDR